MRGRTAIIPAGGTIPADYAQRAGTPHRALALLGPDNRPVMQVVVNALRESGLVERIVAVAAPPVQAVIHDVDHWLPAESNGSQNSGSQNSGSQNILNGLRVCEDADAGVLVCASDLPFLSPAAVRGFAKQCEDWADITVGLVRAAAYEKAYVDAPPSQYVTLKETGPVTLSGLFQLRPSALLRNKSKSLLARAFAARKSQWRMASLLGPRLLWQWTTRTLAVAAVQARAERLLHCRAQIVDNADPALACDMDNADDYAYARSRTNAAFTS